MSNAVYGTVGNCFASHAPGIQLNYELLRIPTCIPSVYRYLARNLFLQHMEALAWKLHVASDHGYSTRGWRICRSRFVATIIVSSVFFINGFLFKQTRLSLYLWINGVSWRLHLFPSWQLPCAPQHRSVPPFILYALGKLFTITHQQA